MGARTPVARGPAVTSEADQQHADQFGWDQRPSWRPAGNTGGMAGAGNSRWAPCGPAPCGMPVAMAELAAIRAGHLLAPRLDGAFGLRVIESTAARLPVVAEAGPAHERLKAWREPVTRGGSSSPSRARGDARCPARSKSLPQSATRGCRRVVGPPMGQEPP